VLFPSNSENINERDKLKNDTQGMAYRIRSQVHLSGDKKGERLFTRISAFSFLLFVLIYFPCIATISAVKRETGTWKWPAFMFIYTTLLAYFISFGFYQIANLLL